MNIWDISQCLAFRKMHGLGNDFVVIDARDLSSAACDVLSGSMICALGDRHRGVGFDQLALVSDGSVSEHSTPEGASTCDLSISFFNADGSASAACGNATRCIARTEMDATGKTRLRICTARGILLAEDAGGGMTRVNMGTPLLDWADVPLAHPMNTLHLPIEGAPTATGMGNPHCTFFVDDIAQIALEADGAKIEHHPLFPERTNVEFVQILDRQTIRLRIWERGTGVTLASGSCSCAAAVAAARRGLTDRAVSVHVDGGLLQIDWREDGVWMTGPTMHVFDGVLSTAFLQALL